MFLNCRTLVPLSLLVLVAYAALSEDEQQKGCDLTTEQPCRSNSSLCVPLEHVGDGYIDCPDGSDEDCPDGWFVCRDLSACISPELLQDGVPDCFDESDEECEEWQHECLCGFPRCVDVSLVGDGSPDCLEGSDEMAIDKSTYICPDEFVENQEIRRRKRQIHERVRTVHVDSTATTSFANDQPTGLLSSTVGTFINAGTTSEYVTLVHGTTQSGQYTQVTLTSSRVFYAIPSRLIGAKPEGLVSSVIQTQVNDAAKTVFTNNFVRTHIDGTYVELINTVTEIHSPLSLSPTAAFSFPIHGTFTETTGTQNAKLEVSLLDGGALSPQAVVENKVVTLMGTKGLFIKDGDFHPTTYNVFTGSYVNDHRTYLFFFGNTALPEVSETFSEIHATQTLPKEVVLKKGGDQTKIFVDMEKDLEVIMPSKSLSIDSTIAPDMLMGEGLINGHHMEGVFIESSEGFEMQGAKSESLETSMVTITIGRPNSHTRVVKATSVSEPEEVTVLSMEEKLHQMNEKDNEIDGSLHLARIARLTGDEIIADLKPSQPRNINLPTFTIKEEGETLEKVVGINKNIVKPVSTTVNERNSEPNEREGKSLDDIRSRFNLENGDSDSDLPTVTYVGFADFTTTIAGTVVVFTPRSQSPSKFLKAEVTKTKSSHQKTSILASSTTTPTFSTLAPRLAPSTSISEEFISETSVLHKQDHKAFVKADESTPEKTSDAYSTIVTHRYNSVDPYPTGLVSSIGGTIVSDDMTTLLTTYVYGTYINGQYAQVVESTSSIFYLVSRSATTDIHASSPVEFMVSTEILDFSEPTTEFYDYLYEDEGGAVTEDLVPFVEDIIDNNIGRSVASSPGQQMIIDTKDKKIDPEEPVTTQPLEDYSVSVYTSYITYFRDGETTVSTAYESSTIYLPFLETQNPTVPFSTTEDTVSSHPTHSTYLTTLTFYTTLFVDGVTKVSSHLQVYTKTAGSAEIKPTSSLTLATTSLADDIAVIESIPYDDYEFTTESLIESFTESISESMSESSTDSSAQDVTEPPGVPLDSSLVPDEEVNAVFFPRTYYTTFTYFTTYYRSETSTIVSSLETLTQIVTDLNEHEKHKSLTPIVPTYPVTYYTTYTYWTTFFKENETVSTSTEKTLSSVATPSVSNGINVADDFLLPVLPTTSSVSIVQTTPAITTFYTTYTYYTSTYLQDSTIVNSRLKTITSVVTATPSLESDVTVAVVEGTAEDKPFILTGPKSTGLLSTIRGSTVIDGTTTVFSTNIIGTIVDGLYAQIQSTTSHVIPPTTSTPFFIFPVTTTETSSSDSPFFIFPSVSEESTLTSTSKTESPFFVFPGVSEESTLTSTSKTESPFFVFPAVSEESTLTSTSKTESPFFAFPSVAEESTLTSTAKTESPFFAFPSVSEESVTSTSETNVPFFIFPSTTEETSTSTIEKEEEDLIPITIEDAVVTTQPSLFITPTLDSSISETTTDISETPTATEALPEFEITTDQPEDEDGLLPSNTQTIPPGIPTFPSGSRFRTHKSSRPDIFAFARRSPTRSHPSTITRDGITPTITATPASGSDETLAPSATRPFRFGFITSSGTRAAPSSSVRFRFQSSKFDLPNSGPTSSAGFRRQSSSVFRFASSSTNTFALTNTLSSNRFTTKTSSVFPGARPSIFPSSVIPKPIATTEFGDELEFEDEEDFNNPASTLRPFSFRRPNNPGTAGTRSSVPFALLGRRTTKPATSKAVPAGSRFQEAINKKPEKTFTPATESETESPVTEEPNTASQPARLSLEERRQNRFRQSRPNLSKLFQRRNPLKKEDLNNEATEAEPLFVEVDGRRLTPEELDAILAEEIVSRKKRQAGEFGARTTSRGTVRGARPRSNAAPPRDQGKSQTPSQSQTPNAPNARRNSRQTSRSLSPSSPRNNANSQFTLSNNRARAPPPSDETNKESENNSQRRSTSRTSLPQRPSSSRTRNVVPLGNIRGRGFRRPSTDNNFRASSKFAPTRPTSGPIRRPRPTSNNNNNNNNNKAPTRRPNANTNRPNANTNRNRGTNPIENFRNKPTPEIPTEPPKIFPSDDGGFLIQDALTVTRELPVKATIPLVEDGVTVQKEVITASYQTEIVQPDQITQTDIDGTVKLLLSSVEGPNDLTHYIIEPTETTTVTFTKTFVGGRRTSVEHILPTTAYNIVTVTRSKGGSDLQQLLQLLLGQQQQQNPLLAALGLGQQVSSEVIHTRSYVTTVTNMLSTVIPVIFRGKTIETTVVDQEVNVITATELSTETLFAPASISPFQNPGNLNQLLPLFLQGQLQQQSPQIRPTREPAVDTQTVNPQLLEQLIKQQQQLNEEPQKSPKRGKPAETVPKPAPVETSIVTLYVSGRRPGEFSTLLSTVTVGDEATRIKRGSLHTKSVQATVLPHYIETDKGLFQLPETYDVNDMDWYIMSAMNEIDTSDVNKVTPSLETFLGTLSLKQNGTHSFNGHPFLWEGTAELAPLRRNVRSAQRGNEEENARALGQSSRARKIQEGSPQQIIGGENARPVLGQFNVPGRRFQSRLISEQVQNLQPPTTYYTTFTYYTTLVDEVGHEFVQSSEETITQIATNGNVRFDDFTKTAEGSSISSKVPLQAKFTLDDAIIPGMPRPVPDPVFPEPPPPFGPIIKHFDDVQPFQPVPQPFVPEEFRIQHDKELTETAATSSATGTASSGRRVPQDSIPHSPQLIIQPVRDREEEPIASSQKPRRIVLTRKRPVQASENNPSRIVKNSRPINHFSDNPKKDELTLTDEEAEIKIQEAQGQVLDIQKDSVSEHDTDNTGALHSPGPENGENLQGGTRENRPGSRQRARVTVTNRRPVSPAPTIEPEDTLPASTSGGRRRVVVTRRLPQPTVTASRLHPIVATVSTYYTVYSYLYTLYEDSTPFSVSTREVTVSNEIEPTVVSVLPKFQTGTAVGGFYTLEMGGATATLGERIIDSLTTQIFLASATLVELSPEVIRQNAENLKQSVEETPDSVTESSTRHSGRTPSRLQSSLVETELDAQTDTPFLTTSIYRATKARGQVSQRQNEGLPSVVETTAVEDTAIESLRRTAGVRNRGRGTVRFDDIHNKSKFTITRRRPITPTTSEPAFISTLKSVDPVVPRAPVRPHGRIAQTSAARESVNLENTEEETLDLQRDTSFQEEEEITHSDRLPSDVPLDEFTQHEKATISLSSLSQADGDSHTSIIPEDETLSPLDSVDTEEAIIDDTSTDNPPAEVHEPSPTPTLPTRPPRTSLRRDDIPIIRRPGSERLQRPRPFVTQEILTASSSDVKELHPTTSSKEDFSATQSLPSEDLTESHTDDDYYYEDYYYYDDYYGDEHENTTEARDEPLSETSGANNESTPVPSKTGPNFVRPTQLTITSNSFDIIEALKRERTYTQIVAPSRTSEPGPRTRTRTQIETPADVPLPSNVVYSTYATTTLLPILGGEHSITLTILTSTLVTLAEEQVHLITDSPELFDPALVTGTASSPSLSVPSILAPSITSELGDTQAADITPTIPIPGGEEVSPTVETQTSRAFGFLSEAFSDQGDKSTSTLPPEQVITNNFEKFRRPITLPPSTLSDQMLLFSSPKPDHPKVTQVTGGDDGLHQTNTYFTTYTYYNTLLAANKPFVITSKQTVENIVTVPIPDNGNFIERTEVIFDTQTYYTTHTFTQTVDERIVTSEEVLTQVVITEAPSVQRATIQPTYSSILTKTYFTTLTYYNTALSGDTTVVSTDTVVSSEVITETTYITGTQSLGLGGFTLTTGPSLQPASVSLDEEDLILYATKTIYTTLTYLTTILEGSETITASRIEVSSNVLTEPLTSALSSEELMSLKSSYLSGQVTSTGEFATEPQTLSYMKVGDNVYKQFRTFFATFTHYTTLAGGVVNSRVETQTKVLTSVITTTAIPASLLINPTLSSTAFIGVTTTGFLTPGLGSSIQLDPSYLSSLKSSFLASQSTALSKPEDSEGVQATVLVEEGDKASGTLVVSDSTTSATLLVRPTDEASTSILSGQTVVIFDSAFLASLKSSFLASPSVSFAVNPSPIVTSEVLDSSAILTATGEMTTLGPEGSDGGDDLDTGSETPLTVRPAVIPVPAAGVIPAAGVVSEGSSGAVSSNAAPALAPSTESSDGSGGLDGVSITGSNENGLNIDLGPMLTAVAGILRNNLNSQLASGKSDENRRKVSTPLRPSNTIIAAQREPLLIPVGGVGASLSSSLDQTEGAEHVFIPLRRPSSVVQGQPRFPSRPTSTQEPVINFASIFPDLPRPNVLSVSVPTDVKDMERFGPTFHPPSTQAGFTAMTEESFGPTRVSVISGSQTIFFGGVDIKDLPPPGQPASVTDEDRTTVVLQPSQPVLIEETRPVPIPIRVPSHSNNGIVTSEVATAHLQDQIGSFNSHPDIIFNRPSPKMPQPSRIGPQTIVSIEGDNRIVRTQVIQAQSIDEYRPEQPVIVSPVKGEFVLQSTVGVGIISGGNDDTRPQPPPGLEGTSLTGSETVLIGQSTNNGRTTVVRGSSTVLSGATTIFGSLFTRPAQNNEPLGGDLTSFVSGPSGISTRVITRVETSARIITATHTDIIFTRGLTSTLTQVILSTLPLRTIVTTIVGTSTSVNYVSATVDGHVPKLNNNFHEDDPTTYPPGSPFDPANYPSFPLDPRPVEEEDLHLPGSAEVVLNEASLGIAEDNEISRVIESQSPDQEINVGGPVRAPISKCNPQCSATRQEVCKLIRGVHSCVCRAGYSRRNGYDSCKPSVAYNIQLLLDGMSDGRLVFDPVLHNISHPITQDLADITIHGLDGALMASQLGPHYRTATVTKFTDTRDMAIPASGHPTERGVVAEIKVELMRPEEDEEEKLITEWMLQKTLESSLKASNYSLGDSEIFANREVAVLASQDFDECSHEDHNDCSHNAHCSNTAGSFLCICRDGFKDMGDMPGRECAVQTEQCSFCNYQGECITKVDGTKGCRCSQWFSGEKCQINLRVMLIALVTIGSLLVLLLFLCLVLCCLRSRRSANSLRQVVGAPTFLRARGTGMASTLDRRAMIHETSSESSMDHPRIHGTSFLGPKHPEKPDRPMRPTRSEMNESRQSNNSFSEDRSVGVHTTLPPVLIPRVKGPAPRRPSVVSRGENGEPRVMIGADARSDLANSQQAFVDLLEQASATLPPKHQGHTSRRESLKTASIHGSTNRINRSRSHSREHLNDSFLHHQLPPGSIRSRSSDRLHHGSSHDFNSEFGVSFSFRDGERTMSEARSYDETTVRPPIRTMGAESFYSSKALSSQHISDEHQTMAERDGGSTVVYPQTELYRPVRDTDSLSDMSDHHSKAASSRAASRSFFS